MYQSDQDRISLILDENNDHMLASIFLEILIITYIFVKLLDVNNKLYINIYE